MTGVHGRPVNPKLWTTKTAAILAVRPAGHMLCSPCLAIIELNTLHESNIDKMHFAHLH